MELPPLHEGTFVERINRFLGLVRLNGEEILCFIPNPGRMEELLLKNATVYLVRENYQQRSTESKQTPSKESGRKTEYDLFGVLEGNTFVCIDSRLPSRLFSEAIETGGIEEFDGYMVEKKEPRFKDVRFDLLLMGKEVCVVETKSCTLVVDGTAMFPDAPTERGRKHLYRLIEARNSGMRAVVVFVIQRDDAFRLSPNKKTDPEFALTLFHAMNSGVETLAYLTRKDENRLYLAERIPVEV
jgi:sugar fermentation stimulation protein A